jgi:hypothetical protein
MIFSHDVNNNNIIRNNPFSKISNNNNNNNNFFNLNNPLNIQLNSSEKKVIKFNKRVYQFNSSNINLINNKLNPEASNIIETEEEEINNNIDNDSNSNIKEITINSNVNQDILENENLNENLENYKENPNENHNENNIKISDLLIENIVSEMKNINDEKNLKIYLKSRISNIVCKTFLKI